MKPILFYLLVLLCLAGCKKKENTPVNDNANDTPVQVVYPPLGTADKDVVWKVHYQGIMTSDPLQPGRQIFDTGYHLYATIRYTGIDTLIDPAYQPQDSFHKYSVVTTTINARDNYTYQRERIVYIRHDSVKNVLYTINSPYYSASMCLNLELDELVNTIPECVPSWFKKNCKLEKGTATIFGKTYPALYMTGNGERLIYQTALTGGIWGIHECLSVALYPESHLHSTSYIYKTDTFTVSYPHKI
jgi:hypothetical protein